MKPWAGLMLLLLLTSTSITALAARPWFHPFGSSKASDSSSPEQVHVTLAGANHVKVTWITSDASIADKVDYGTSPNVYSYSSSTSDTSTYSYMLYKSGTVHNAVLGPLKDNTTYYYRIGGTGPEYKVKTPPPPGPDVPITFAVVGDLGQTRWSKSTLEHVQRSASDVLLFPGDLSYADYYQPLWDSFGRLVEPVASSLPWMVTHGNHDVEKLPLFGRPFKAYDARWSMPYKESGSTSNLYYSFEVAGVHVLMLGSYTDFDSHSDQYRWLQVGSLSRLFSWLAVVFQADLRKVDRNKTPWLIALVHAPWYNSNVAHQGDGDKMMAAMEALLRQAKVDLVFAGHVHAYERTVRVFKYASDPCGIMHITIGDGGNREGLARRFKNPKPEWSAFRDASFGHGELEIFNATHAEWSWHRNDDDEAVLADKLLITSLSSSFSGCHSNSVLA